MAQLGNDEFSLFYFSLSSSRVVVVIFNGNLRRGYKLTCSRTNTSFQAAGHDIHYSGIPNQVRVKFLAMKCLFLNGFAYAMPQNNPCKLPALGELSVITDCWTCFYSLILREITGHKSP